MSAYSGHKPHAASAPGGCCLHCYRAAERLLFPFVVFCRHKGRLIEVRGPRHYASFDIGESELVALVAARTLVIDAPRVG